MIDSDGALSPALVEALAVPGWTTSSPTSPHDLRMTLTRAFYEHLHLGWAAPRDTSPVRRDLRLERQLADALDLPSAIIHTTDLAPAPGATDPVVVLDGVRVLVPSRDVVARTVTEAGPQVTYRRAPLRAAVSPGFLLLDRRSREPDACLDQRIYVHVEDPGAAPAVWAAAVGALESAEVAYVTKASSLRSQYGRTDAIVVYRSGTGPDVAGSLVDTVAGLPGVGVSTSLFAARVGSGVATASEPVDERPGMRGLSFGLHRAALLARAVIRSRCDGHELRTAVVEELVAGRVDPQDLSRNIQEARS